MAGSVPPRGHRTRGHVEVAPVTCAPMNCAASPMGDQGGQRDSRHPSDVHRPSTKSVNCASLRSACRIVPPANAEDRRVHPDSEQEPPQTASGPTLQLAHRRPQSEQQRHCHQRHHHQRHGRQAQPQLRADQGTQVDAPHPGLVVDLVGHRPGRASANVAAGPVITSLRGWSARVTLRSPALDQRRLHRRGVAPTHRHGLLLPRSTVSRPPAVRRALDVRRR